MPKNMWVGDACVRSGCVRAYKQASVAAYVRARVRACLFWHEVACFKARSSGLLNVSLLLR
eukprot:11976865-Prorocentrum_lima.AAC.1